MKLFKLFFLLLISTLGFSQLPNNSNLIRTIAHNANDFTTDRLGNIYLFNDNFIWLYNNTGDSIAAFNSRKFGEITSVDVTDPYKILVFFSDYNLIVFLDNYLSLNGDPIELETLGYDQITMACISRGGGVWVFDAIKQQAIHLNENFKSDKHTVNLSQWFGKRIEPNFMMEYNNQLFINEFETGVYQFDHFGTYLKKITIDSLNSFQRMNEDLHYLKSPNYCQFNILNFQETCRLIPSTKILNFRIERNKFYILSSKKLEIFSTK